MTARSRAPLHRPFALPVKRHEPPAKEAPRETDTARARYKGRVYSHRWQRASRTFLARNPLCVHCAKIGRDRAATDVDHIVPHDLIAALDSGNRDRIRNAQQLFWDSSNWQALCHQCHARKTVRDNGGFKNRRSEHAQQS